MALKHFLLFFGCIISVFITYFWLWFQINDMDYLFTKIKVPYRIMFILLILNLELKCWMHIEKSYLWIQWLNDLHNWGWFQYFNFKSCRICYSLFKMTLASPGDGQFQSNFTTYFNTNFIIFYTLIR